MPKLICFLATWRRQFVQRIPSSGLNVLVKPDLPRNEGVNPVAIVCHVVTIWPTCETRMVPWIVCTVKGLPRSRKGNYAKNETH